jgi:hypothetical protein
MRQSTLDDISYTVAAERGRTAAANGVAYDSNPYDKVTQPGLHLRWSRAHNAMRVLLVGSPPPPRK